MQVDIVQKQNLQVCKHANFCWYGYLVEVQPKHCQRFQVGESANSTRKRAKQLAYPRKKGV